jgi:nucleoid-associated protein YgaU
MRIYEVKKDDSPFHIALSQLGDPRRANEIMSLNNLKRDDNIYPGQKLKLPNVEYKRNPYKVKKDDNLWKIALEQLGNPGRIGEIMALNKLEKEDDILYDDQIIELPSNESNERHFIKIINTIFYIRYFFSKVEVIQLNHCLKVQFKELS